LFSVQFECFIIRVLKFFVYRTLDDRKNIFLI